MIKLRDKYYTENWHRALQSIVRYKNPTVANSEAYTLLSLNEPNQPIFFHAEFCKPGKNVYMVEHCKTNQKSVYQGFFDMIAFGGDVVSDKP